MDNLKELYIDQLQDLYSACDQSETATRKLMEAAADADLKAALKAGVDGIAEGKAAAAEIIRAHGADPEGEFCRGMQGLVKEAHAHALEEDFGDDAVRDAMIITQYQRMTHYGLAGWGCLVAFAKRLDLADDVAKLERNLDQTYDGDRHMTQIATSGINAAAA